MPRPVGPAQRKRRKGHPPSIIGLRPPARGRVGQKGARMSWWGWVVGGAVLLGAELALGVNAQFYLVFVGGAAILVGVVTELVYPFAPWAQWAVFAVLSL